MKTDTKWFRAELARVGISVRELGRRLGIDAAGISLTLRGQRNMRMDEAVEIARQLGVPATEVMRRAGIDLHEGTASLKILHYVDSAGMLHKMPAKNAAIISAPVDVPADSMAVQVRSPGAACDGWLLIVSAQRLEPVAAVGRLCVAAFGENITVGVISRAYQGNLYNVTGVVHTGDRESLQIDWASPVLWIRPR